MARDDLAPWAKLYSGVVPFESKGRSKSGADCFGLVYLVYREQFGIELPSYLGEYADAHERAEISRAIHGALPEWVKVETPEPGDVVLAWQKSRSDWSHVGIYTGERQILHAHERNGYALLESVDSQYWHGRIVGYYRHPSRVVREPDEVLPALPPDSRVAGYVTVAFLASPFEGSPLTRQVVAGPSIASIVTDLGIVSDASGYIRVTHQDRAIDEEWWPFIRPKAGTYLTVVPVPGLPAVIIPFLIAAAQAAAAAASGVAAVAAAAVAAAGTPLGAAVITQAVGFGIAQLAKSVAAPSGSNPKTPTGPGSTRVGGNFGNEIRLYAPVPVGFGKMKIAPMFAARPYYEFNGTKRYLHALFLVGYGRYKISDVRVNDVAIEELIDDYDSGEVDFQLIEGGIATGGYIGEIIDDATGQGADHHWRLDESSGNAIDSIGAVLPLTRTSITQVAGLLTGDANQAAQLNGTSSRLSTTAAAAITNTAEWTVEMWVKPETGMATGSEVCLWLNGDTTNGWGLYLFGNPGEEPRRLRFKVFVGGVVLFADLHSPSINPTKTPPIYHVAFSKRSDGSQFRTHSIYVNGAKESEARLTPTPPTPASAFTVGAERSSGGAYSKFFKGTIDEVSTYNHRVDDGTIFSHYDLGTGATTSRGGMPRLYFDTVFEAALGPGALFVTPPSNEVPAGLLPAWLTASIPGVVDTIQVHAEFTNGIYRIADSGAGRQWEVRVQAEFRRTDVANDEWVTLDDRDYVRQKVREPVPISMGRSVPPGLYEVRIRPRWDVYVDGSLMGSEDGGVTEGGAGNHPNNYTGGNDTAVAMSDLQVHSIRGIDFHRKAVMLEGVSMIGVKLPVQATGTVTCVYERLLPVWNGAAFTAPQITRSAAWAALDVLRGSQGTNPRPIPDSRIKLDEFLAWAGRGNDVYGVPICSNVDLYVDYQTDTFSLFQQIAGLAFASLDFPDGTFGVIEDRAQTTPVGLVTARNAQGFRGWIFYQENPHALLVRYISAKQSYQETEVTVYDDGFSLDGSLDDLGQPTVAASKFEEFRLIGLTEDTNPDKHLSEVVKHARIRMLLNRLRNEEWELTQYLGQLPFRRGKLVKLAHPIGLLGQRQYRVTKVTVSGPNITEAYVEIPNLVYEAGKSYAATWWKASTSSPFTEVVADRPVNNLSGQSPTHKIVFTTPVAAASAPSVGDLLAFGEVNLVTTDCIIRAISPNPGFTARVELIPATTAVFDTWKSKFPPRDPQITVPPPNVQPAPPVPVILSVKSGASYVQETAEGFIAHIAITFKIPPGGAVAAESVQARFRLSDPLTTLQPWSTATPAQADQNVYLIGRVSEGLEYEIQVRSISALGVASRWTASVLHTVEIVTFGGPGPDDVTNLRIEPGLLRWDYPNLPLGFAGFQVRWHYGNWNDWETAERAHQGFLSENVFPLSGLPAGEPIAVHVKAFDRFNQESDASAFVLLNLANRPLANVVFELHAEPNWTATKVNCTVVGGKLVPTASGADTIEGSYVYEFFSDDIKIGRRLVHLTTRDASGRFQTRVDYSTKSLTPAWNSNPNALAWDKDGDNDVDAGDLAALAWAPAEPYKFFGSEIIPTERIRYQIRLRLLACTNGVAIGAAVTSHVLYSDIMDLRFDVQDFVVSEDGSRLPVNPYFEAVKTVTLSVQGLIEGEQISVHVVDKSAAGPLVRILDSNGNGISKTVDALVVGIPSQYAFEAGLVDETQ